LRLGYYESLDQVAAAAWIKKNMSKHFDSDNFGIWGWSYGGFLTLSTLLLPDSGFRCGVSVAPVASWLYYDTAYTERYMRTPSDNPEGYKSTSIVNQILERGLQSKLLLMHGTGDDNVHFQNSAMLNEVLVEKEIQYDTMLYTNKNHGISGNGARPHLYKLMSDWLQDCFAGNLD